MEIKNIGEKIESTMQSIKKPSIVKRIMSAISYIGILSLLPIVLRPKSEYVRFHARQGLALFITEIIFTLIWIIPLIGWVIGF